MAMTSTPAMFRRGPADTYSSTSRPARRSLRRRLTRSIYAIERGLHAPVDSLTRMNRWIATALSIGLCGALIGPILYLYGRRRMAIDTDRGAMRLGDHSLRHDRLSVLDHAFCARAGGIVSTAGVHTARKRVQSRQESRPELPSPVSMSARLPRRFSCCWRFRSATDGGFVSFIGALPLVFLMAIYQWLCFGSPFRTAVEASTPFTQAAISSASSRSLRPTRCTASPFHHTADCSLSRRFCCLHLWDSRR